MPLPRHHHHNSTDATDFDVRYASPNWDNVRLESKRKQQLGERVKCSYCLELFAWEDVEAHHTSYAGDHDTAGVNVFALCGGKNEVGTCHHEVHKKENWIRDAKDPVWKSGNTTEIVQLLQQGYYKPPIEKSPIRVASRWVKYGLIGAGGLLLLLVAGQQQNNAIATSKVQPQKADLVVDALPAPAANLRATPNGTVITTLPNGSRLPEVKARANQWCQVSTGTHSGWIFCPLLKKSV